VDKVFRLLDIEKPVAVANLRLSLLLTPPWSEERVVLVLTPDAIRLCREDGHERVPPSNAVAWVEP
jgi:hypothetical protein